MHWNSESRSDDSRRGEWEDCGPTLTELEWQLLGSRCMETHSLSPGSRLYQQGLKAPWPQRSQIILYSAYRVSGIVPYMKLMICFFLHGQWAPWPLGEELVSCHWPLVFFPPKGNGLSIFGFHSNSKQRHSFISHLKNQAFLTLKWFSGFSVSDHNNWVGNMKSHLQWKYDEVPLHLILEMSSINPAY